LARKEQQRNVPIPEFASREEEAEFWDTHSLADYWDEFKPLKVRFGKNLSTGINIPLDHKTLQTLSSLAMENGVDATTLIRTWITQQLEETELST
jgi:hypothetical protein